MNETITEGGCLCGAVRYRSSGTPVNASNCHCTMCQKSAGAIFVSWMTFPNESFEITKGNLKYFKSSDKGERGFCEACGGSITFTHADVPGVVDITTASAADPGAWPPTHHIWTSTQVPWFGTITDLPSYKARKSDG